MNKYNGLYLTLVLALAGCSVLPNGAHYNRGTPESLLDVSSEVVSLQLSSENSVDQMVEWIDKDEPTRAELHCDGSDAVCNAAKEVFKLYGINYEVVAGSGKGVDLIYERVLARDCDNRYMDNHINPYNMNHPTFGCSLASNMVQSVSDKKQFVNPSLLGFRDAKKAVHDTRDYYDDSQRRKAATDDKYQVKNLDSN
jgi:hypothetical protein